MKIDTEQWLGTGWFRAVHVCLSMGTVGPMVLHLQALLGVAEDGFGPLTEAALRSLQATHGLAETGKMSSAEWSLAHPVLDLAAPEPGEALMEVQREFGLNPTGWPTKHRSGSDLNPEIRALTYYKVIRGLEPNLIVDSEVYASFMAPVPEHLRKAPR